MTEGTPGAVSERPPVSTEVEAALARVARARHLLVASDFDGVLAPLVVDPMASRALPGSLESLQQLAEMPDTWCALVSGRDLATLATVTGLPSGEDAVIAMAASHGAESNRAGVADAADPALPQRVSQLVSELRQLAEQHPGSRVEPKTKGAALHTRGLPDGVAAPALAAAMELGHGIPGARTVPGSAVVEIALAHADKGTAVARLRAVTGADAVVYLGDDVTDEDVMRSLDPGTDLGIKVGDGETAAGVRVGGPADVVTVLARLATLRRSVAR